MIKLPHIATVGEHPLPMVLLSAVWMWTLVFGHHEIAHRPTATRRRARLRCHRSPRAGGESSAVKAENWGRSNQHPALLGRQDCALVACYRSLYAPRTGGA